MQRKFWQPVADDPFKITDAQLHKLLGLSLKLFNDAQKKIVSLYQTTLKGLQKMFIGHEMCVCFL